MAISTRCAHLGCPVRYVTASQRFICPCHGGVYGFQGEVTGGPPVRPLDRFYTKVEAGRVLVGPRFSLNNDLERFSPRDPSNHLDGLWQYLYPSTAEHMSFPNHSFPRPPAQTGPAGLHGAGAERQTGGADAEERGIEVPVSALGWLDERTGASPFLRGFLYRKVPRARTGSTRSARRRCSRSSRRP